MISVEFLKNKPEHIESVSKWIYKAFIENTNRAKSIDYERINNVFRDRQIERLPVCLIAVENDECIGAISLVESDLRQLKEFTPWIVSLYVKEEMRNRGIGQLLINEIIKVAKGFGYHRIYLRTETVPGYYKKLGWNYIGEEIDEFEIKVAVFSKDI